MPFPQRCGLPQSPAACRRSPRAACSLGSPSLSLAPCTLSRAVLPAPGPRTPLLAQRQSGSPLRRGPQSLDPGPACPTKPQGSPPRGPRGYAWPTLPAAAPWELQASSEPWAGPPCSMQAAARPSLYLPAPSPCKDLGWRCHSQSASPIPCLTVAFCTFHLTKFPPISPLLYLS